MGLLKNKVKPPKRMRCFLKEIHFNAFSECQIHTLFVMCDCNRLKALHFFHISCAYKTSLLLQKVSVSSSNTMKSLSTIIIKKETVLLKVLTMFSLLSRICWLSSISGRSYVFLSGFPSQKNRSLAFWWVHLVNTFHLPTSS